MRAGQVHQAGRGEGGPRFGRLVRAQTDASSLNRCSSQQQRRRGRGWSGAKNPKPSLWRSRTAIDGTWRAQPVRSQRPLSLVGCSAAGTRKEV